MILGERAGRPKRGPRIRATTHLRPGFARATISPMLGNSHDGGPAFPRPATEGNEDAQEGMSLRDYFAAQVAAVLAPSAPARTAAGVAKDAYDLAEALLAERHRRFGP